MTRRALGALLTASVLAIGLSAGPGRADDGGSSGRVDVLFDTAKGIVPGQVVKVAGARVGTVTGVELTDDYHARLQLKVDPRFTPFRRDARCEIQPEGLISENFVQCDPGSVDAPELTARGGGVPTVPLARTSVPVNLTDLFEIWDAPVRDRLRLLLNTLGAGVAGQGEQLNDLLRRANPTLGLVRKAVRIVDDQRDELQRTLVQTHAVTKELARQPERLQAFVDEGARVFETTANRRAELRDGLRRLPAALEATRPALESLDRFSAQGAPLTRRLTAAAPELDRLLVTVPPAGKVALPALRALGTTATKGRRAVRSARPVVRRLRRFAVAAQPTLALTDKVLVDLRGRGFVENFLSFAYYAAAATARYDTISHIFPAHLVASQCMTLATTTNPACDANYTRPAPTSAAARSAKGTDGGRGAPVAPGATATPSSAAASTGAPEPAAGEKPSSGLLPALPGSGTPSTPTPGPAGPLLDFLLGS